MNERIQQIFIKQDESEITNTGQLLNSASILVGWRCQVLHQRQPRWDACWEGSSACLRNQSSIGGVLLEALGNKLSNTRATRHKKEKLTTIRGLWIVKTISLVTSGQKCYYLWAISYKMAFFSFVSQFHRE